MMRCGIFPRHSQPDTSPAGRTDATPEHMRCDDRSPFDVGSAIIVGNDFCKPCCRGFDRDVPGLQALAAAPGICVMP